MKLSSFTKAVLIIASSYAALRILFDVILYPQIIPVMVVKFYMFLIIVGVVLYYTSSRDMIEETLRPLLNFIFNPEKKGSIKIGQYVMYAVLPVLFAFLAYDFYTPKFPEPTPLRVIHPAPPSTMKLFGQQHNILTLVNPIRELETTDPEKFNQLKREGGFVFFKNCFFCHGDFLNGRGITAQALNPVPANFQDPGILPMLMESFLFWRISTGGPGLPNESWPWQSAMPIWQTIITEKEAWKVIAFLYDYTPDTIRPRTFNE